MKNRLWIGILLVVALLGAGLVWQAATPLPSAAQQTTDQTASEQTSTDRTISVSGSGEVNAVPDTAVVTLGVQTEAQEASAALSQNNTQMQAVIAALKDAGVASADIQTQALQLYPRYEQKPSTSAGTEPPTLVGYTALNLVQVTVRQVDTLGSVLDAAVQAGSNQIQNIQFQISDTSALLDQAREAAWSDAMHKATQLAGLAEAQLGPVMTITESSNVPRPFIEAPVGAGAAVPVEPGTQSVTVNIQVTWQLQ